MPVSLTSKKQRVVKNFFYPTYNILPLHLFFPLLFFLPFPNAFLPSSFCARVTHTLGHTSQNAIISSF